MAGNTNLFRYETGKVVAKICESIHDESQQTSNPAARSMMAATYDPGLRNKRVRRL